MLKKYILKYPLIGLFALLLVAQAQPEQLLEKYKNVMDLSVQVMAMHEMDTTTELTFSSEQAAQLLPILDYLQTSDTLTNEEALAYKEQIDTEILTPEQLEWVTARSAELLPETFSSNNPPPGGMSTAMKLFRGEPVNMVKIGFSKDALNELVDIMNSKAG